MPFGLGPAGWFLGPYWWYWYNPWSYGRGLWGYSDTYSFRIPGWGFPYGAPFYGYPYGAGFGYFPTKEQEKSWLEEQRKILEGELEDIRQRIEELEES